MTYIDTSHVYAFVGPRWLDNFPQHRQRERGDDIIGMDVKHMLQNIHTNFVRLTHRVPMAQVEDFPEAMQQHVVGVPYAWVQLFRQLTRVFVCFHDQHLAPQV